MVPVSVGFWYPPRAIFVPVGQIWRFDLEKTFSLDFGEKCNFSKIRIEHVMLNCLAITENTRKKTNQKNRATVAGSRQNSSEIASGNFQYIIRTRVDLSYPWQKTEIDCERRRSKLDWIRVNLRWKRGQLKLPNGPDQKLVS